MRRGTSKIRRHLTIHLLVIALLTGAVANAVAGVAACLPKACCCTQTMPQGMNHGNPQDLPSHCLPEKPAPCCHIEQEQPTPQMAISTTPDVNPHRWSIGPALSATYDAWSNNPQHLMQRLEDGRHKIPIVPIYLQTLSILC